MTKAEAKRWAASTAAEFIRASWDKCDWEEKSGPDGSRIDEAVMDLASALAQRGSNPDDKKPRTGDY